MDNLDASIIRISGHAIDRFRERTGAAYSTAKVIDKLRQMLSDATEVQLKKKFAVIALLNHHFEQARYFRAGGHIFVVVGDELRTIHNGTAGRWEKIDEKEK